MKVIKESEVACLQSVGDSNLRIALLNDGTVLFVNEEGAVIMGANSDHSIELLQGLIEVATHLLSHIADECEDHSHATKH